MLAQFHLLKVSRFVHGGVVKTFRQASSSKNKKARQSDCRAFIFQSILDPKLLSESIVETVTRWFEVDVLAELARFPSAMFTVHADVFPFD